MGDGANIWAWPARRSHDLGARSPGRGVRRHATLRACARWPQTPPAGGGARAGLWWGFDGAWGAAARGSRTARALRETRAERARIRERAQPAANGRAPRDTKPRPGHSPRAQLATGTTRPTARARSRAPDRKHLSANSANSANALPLARAHPGAENSAASLSRLAHGRSLSLWQLLPNALSNALFRGPARGLHGLTHSPSANVASLPHAYALALTPATKIAVPRDLDHHSRPRPRQRSHIHPHSHADPHRRIAASPHRRIAASPHPHPHTTPR